MKVASKALNEMNAENSTIGELESAAHTAFARRAIAVNAMSAINAKIEAIEEQIPVVTDFMKYREFHQQYRSLSGREQQKYAKNNSYELAQYKELLTKIKEFFPDKTIPTIEQLRKEQTKLQKQYAEQSAVYTESKKEADRLARLARQKRDSQKTVERYLQNEQVAKRKKNQLE